MSSKQEKDRITTALSQWNSPRISRESRLFRRSKTSGPRNRRFGHPLWIIQIHYHKAGLRKQTAQGFTGFIETSMDVGNPQWCYREYVFNPHPPVQGRLVVDYIRDRQRDDE